ncbi:TPA: MFS transporter [Legionella pneumophila]|jgi:MHS family proline/betaine transporter-like MFS transporter|uniref:MFS transporter n=1 Tax=Legionella pneumophila TaxID=446 RepID=UPI00077CA917|nr:MFS transporter [Legionella pneumophila]AMQ28322.1 MFS transporter [Legionella pneumophila subsp. pneumophila]MBN5929588.1 MFS transporter [Legionella pneumophila]MDW8967245.1 MFS transporter [Legionella pneumophila]MDW9135200.1 MFS transporter [Legionella pneumophila]MDW9141375.1 MFS transporter [Legionella pneumophila]
MNISSSSKALFAGVSGTALQWYDFALFGYFAPIIAATYFPNDNQFASLLSAFGIFAVGYLLAPIGSLFFGYIGDQFGRKRALTLSILAMAIPTALISVVPSYQYIGIAAPLLITLLRVIQGFVASSEFTGSAIFLVEHAKPENKAFYGCLTSSAYSTGLIMAGLAASFFTASFMPDWGWRIGFGLALIAGILIFYLRTHVAETPEYEHIAQHDKRRLPFLAALKEAPLAVVGIIGIAWLVSIMTFGTYVFTATYLHSYFHISLGLATLIITLALAVDATLEPFIALLADRIGLLKVIRLGMVAMLILSIPIFYLLATGNVVLIAMGLAFMSILIAITYAPLNAYMVSLLPHQYRYSGFGVAFNVGISLFGGTTPIVMMWLVNTTNNFISPAWYYMFGVIIGLGSIMICEQGRRKLLRFESALTY